VVLKKKLFIILFKILNSFVLKGKKRKIEKIVKLSLLVLKQDASNQQPLLLFLKKLYYAITFVEFKKIKSRKFTLIVPKRLKKTSQFKLFLFLFFNEKK